MAGKLLDDYGHLHRMALHAVQQAMLPNPCATDRRLRQWVQATCQAMHAECAQLYDVRWAMYADHTAKDSLPAQCILICDTTVSMLPTHRKTRNIAAICKGQPTLMNE